MSTGKQTGPVGPTPKDADGYTRADDALPMLGTVCLVKTKGAGDQPLLAVYHCEGNVENLDDYHWTWHTRIARVDDGYVTHWKCVMAHLDQWLSAEGRQAKPESVPRPPGGLLPRPQA